jgi:hypothetical protein
MPKTTEQLAASRAGETAESNGFGSQERPLRPAGLYELKNDDGEVVDRLIVKVHPKFGDGQAAAVERVGYKFVRAAKPEEVKEIEVDAKHLATENPLGGITADETLKGVLARVSALEKENADLKAAQTAESNSGSADSAVKAQAKTETQEEATARVAARQDASTGTGASETDKVEELKATGGDAGSDESEGDDESEDEGAEKPFNKLNRAELETVAEKEQITLPAEADTNAKIREVITKAREEKEAGK